MGVWTDFELAFDKNTVFDCVSRYLYIRSLPYLDIERRPKASSLSILNYDYEMASVNYKYISVVTEL